MSTIQPASLVQSAQSTVYLTGVWLDRVLAVYVAGESLNFTVWLGTVDTAMSIVSSAAVMSVAGSGLTASEPGFSGQHQRHHRFHVLQSSPGVDACSDGTASCVANITLQGSDNSVLMFTAPVFNLTGYLPLVITFNNSVDAPPAAISDGSFIALKNWTGSDWMYYTAVQCDTGMIVGLYCEPCPTGGYCPGGGRVWPLPGYWSFSETSVPVPCVLPQACPGALSNPTLAPDGTRFTEVCADGYSDQYCSTCATDYYSDMPRCLSCGLESADKLELAILLVIAAALFFATSIAVAFLSATGLSMAVAAVLMIQHFSIVGKLAGQQVPANLTWLTQLFAILSMLNFDIQFIKPGCVVGALSFLTVYWITIGLVCGVSALFVGASLVRAVMGQRAEQKERAAMQAEVAGKLATEAVADGMSPRAAQRQSDAMVAAVSTTAVSDEIPWRWRFRARLIHSHLILGSIMYLRLTTMGFQAINCTNVLQSDGSYERFLRIDMTTRCYVGTHLASAFFIWPLLFVYSIGFPLLCFWLLYRNFHGATRAITAATPATRKGTQSIELSVVSNNKSVLPSTATESDQPSQLAIKRNSVVLPPITVMRGDEGCLSPIAVSAAASPNISPRGFRDKPWTGTKPLLDYHGAVSSRTAVSALPASRETWASAFNLSVNSKQPAPASSEEKEQGDSVDDSLPEDTQLSTAETSSVHDEINSGMTSPSSGQTALAAHSRAVTASRIRIMLPKTNRVAPVDVSAVVASPSSVRALKSFRASPFAFTGRIDETDADHRLGKAQTRAAKAALRQLSTDMRRQEMLGYMYRQLKGELYYFRLLFFATSFGFAAVAVLPTDATLRLFLTGLFFLIDLFTTCSMTPFKTWQRNLLSVTVSAFGVLQIFILLALVQLGLRTADGGIDLGHSKTAQTDSSDPSDSLTGSSDEAAYLEMVLGILLVVDVLLIAVVHRKKLVAAWKHCGDRLSPRWLRVRTAVQRFVYRLAGLARVEHVESRQARRDSSLPLPEDDQRAVQEAVATRRSKSERSQHMQPVVAMAALGAVEAGEAEVELREATQLALESVGSAPEATTTQSSGSETEGYAHSSLTGSDEQQGRQHRGSLYKPPVFTPPTDSDQRAEGEEQPGSPTAVDTPARPPRPQLQRNQDGTYVLYNPSGEQSNGANASQDKLRAGRVVRGGKVWRA